MENNVKEINFDLSELEPPEPLVILKEQTSKLTNGEFIKAIMKHSPPPLYMLLKKHSLSAEERSLATKDNPDKVEILIWNTKDTEVENYVKQLVASK